VSADRLDKPAEYACAGIPHYWRFEQINADLTAYTYILDISKRTYLPAGVHSEALKSERPFSVSIGLGTLG
jgi:hypothetical protein